MTELYKTAVEMQELFQQRDWKFCIIGGVAVLRWGRARTTQDVDFTLLAGFGREESFVDELLKACRLRPPCDREFALTNRVILLSDSRGVPVDIALGAIPFEERSIARSSLWEAEPNVFLRTCSAEDLLVHKCFAGRNLDWGDVEGILARQINSLDLAQICRELKPLLAMKEAPASLKRLEELIAQHKKPFTLIKPDKKKR